MPINEEKDFDPIVKTTDENGNVYNFKLVEIVEIGKKEYGIFNFLDPEAPNKKHNIADEDDELIVMRIIKKGNDFIFEVIEDDNEFNYVLDYIEKNEDELEF